MFHTHTYMLDVPDGPTARAQVESDLRRQLQSAQAEQQSCALQAESLFELNSDLIEELSERDGRLRQLEDLVAR